MRLCGRVAWEFHYSIECDATRQFPWSYWTNIAKLDFLNSNDLQGSAPVACWAAVGEGNMERMTRATESILADALRLDAKARAELAAELLASLDGPADPDAASAWEREIQRRVDALEAGAEKLESWENVKRRIATNILGR